MISVSYQHDKDLSKTMLEMEEKLEEVPNANLGAMLKEEVFFSDNIFDIIFNDSNGINYDFSCNNIKLRITPSCLAINNTDYYNAKTMGRIWEVKNSKLIAEMNRALEKSHVPGYQMHDLMDGIDKSGQHNPGVKHYILPLEDHLIEIIASNVGLEKTERLPFKDLLYKPKDDKRELRWKDRYVVLPESLRTMSSSGIKGIGTKISDFRFHSTPLENFRYNKSGLEVYADDRVGESYKISFNKCLKIDVMDTDVATIMVNEYYRAAGYTLIEVKDSKLIENLKTQTTDPDMLKQLERSKHFVLPMRDNLIEIVAEDIAVEKVADKV